MSLKLISNIFGGLKGNEWVYFFIPEPHVTVFTDGLFVVRVGQHFLTQGAALQERLLVHLFPDVANQDLRRVTHAHRVMRQNMRSNTEIQQTTCITGTGRTASVCV